MKKFTVKEIAKGRGVSERAIYKQIKVHSKELEGHIEKIEGKQWIDEAGVKILNKASQGSPVVHVETVEAQELKKAQEEIRRLEAENEKNLNALRNVAEVISQLTQKNLELNELASQSKLYIEQRERAEERSEELQAELGKYKKTWFGLYKKED